MFCYEEKLEQMKLAGLLGEGTQGLDFPRVGDASLESLRDILAKAAVQKLGVKYAYVSATYRDSVVVSVEESDGGPTYYQIPFAVKDGKVELGDATKVEKQTIFRKMEVLSRRTGLLFEGRRPVDVLAGMDMGRMQRLAGFDDVPQQELLTERRKDLTELKTVGGHTVLLEDEEIEEGKVVQPMKIGGVATRGNVVNENNRYYPTSLWKKECERLQETIKAGKLLAELDHPADGKSRLGATAAKYTSVEMDGDLMTFEGEVLETPAGQTLKALLRGGVGVDVSTRGYGSTERKNMDGKEVEAVQSDFELTAIDLVSGHSNLSAEIQYYQEKR